VTAGRCAELSTAAGESLAATATTAHNWLLVEVRGAWPRDVADSAGLGRAESDTFRAWLEAVPSSRLLFIRRPGRAPDQRLVFVVRALERDTEVRRVELDSAAELADVDLERDGKRVDSQLVLVCGHGTRDACCALRGRAVFGALESLVPQDELWLSSHQGGHRFAANVLVLPNGIHLGRVTPEVAASVVGAALAGQVVLEHYRGRTAYSPREQAAERAVREAAGITSLSGLSLAGDDGRYVRLVSRDDRAYRAEVEETEGPVVPASCGAAPEPQALRKAQLV
jgi:hypothetical protein